MGSPYAPLVGVFGRCSAWMSEARGTRDFEASFGAAPGAIFENLIGHKACAIRRSGLEA